MVYGCLTEGKTLTQKQAETHTHIVISVKEDDSTNNLRKRFGHSKYNKILKL